MATTKTTKLYNKLSKSKYKTTKFVYPSSLVNSKENGHYMTFHVNVPANATYVGGNKKYNYDANATTLTNKRATEGLITTKALGTNKIKQWSGSSNKRITSAITLYIPTGLGSSYGLNWDTDNFNITGNLTRNATSLNELKRSFGLDSSDIVGSMKGATSTLTAGATRGLSQLTGLAGVLQSGTKEVENQQLEFLFKGINSRTFNFEFIFTATSRKEAVHIQEIIKEFKLHAHPDYISHSRFGSMSPYYTYPSEFDIQFYSHGQENDFLHKIGACILTGIEVDYSAGGEVAFHRYTEDANSFAETISGSSPVITKVNLAFTEIEFITRQHIEEGF